MRRLLRTLAGRRPRECEHTNRGLARFDEVLRSASLPSLSERVSAGSDSGRRVKLLEVGCGDGRMLLDLTARFGDRIELHGINHVRWPVVADGRGLRATNARDRVVPEDRLRRPGAPTIHLADAQDLAGFPVGGFDLIVSQVVVPHVARKDRVLEECARLLAPGGTFLHEIDNLDGREPDVLATDLPRFSIHERGARVPASAYLERRGIGVRTGRSGDRTVVLATYAKGDGALDLGLRWNEGATVVLKTLSTLDAAHRWGIRSEYRTRAEDRS